MTNHFGLNAAEKQLFYFWLDLICYEMDDHLYGLLNIISPNEWKAIRFEVLSMSEITHVHRPKLSSPT